MVSESGLVLLFLIWLCVEVYDNFKMSKKDKEKVFILETCREEIQKMKKEMEEVKNENNHLRLVCNELSDQLAER